jgi:hypothetical protein
MKEEKTARLCMAAHFERSFFQCGIIGAQSSDIEADALWN